MVISVIGLILVATTGGPDNQIQELRDLVNELREEVAELRTNQETGWVDDQRAIPISDHPQLALVPPSFRARFHNSRST